MNNGEIYKESIALLLKKTDDIKFHIRKLRYENQKSTAKNDIEIDRLEKKLKEAETTMREALTNSGGDVIKPKCGWAHFRVMKDKIVIEDEKETIEEFKVKLPSFVEELIKVSESIKKSGLNKLLESGKIRVEILETITVEPQGKKFEYRYTGE